MLTANIIYQKPGFVKKNLHTKKIFQLGGYVWLTSEQTGEGVIFLHLFIFWMNGSVL